MTMVLNGHGDIDERETTIRSHQQGVQVCEALKKLRGAKISLFVVE